MDLIPVTADYDTISARMREMAATRYLEMIEGLRPHVAQALSDPAGIHDIEPGRLQAYAAIVKLQATMIKELGLLYRVQDRPVVEQEDMISLDEHEEALRLAQEREDLAVAAAAAAAAAAARLELEQREVVDLAVARDRVARGLKALGR